MTRYYRSREGNVTVNDTKTQLTTLGSDVAPGALNVPAGATQLVGVICAGAGHSTAAGSTAIFGRLEGAGLPNGPEVFMIAAHGHVLGNSSSSMNISQYIELDVPVTPGNEILVFAEFNSVDIGDVEVGITLVFA